MQLDRLQCYNLFFSDVPGAVVSISVVVAVVIILSVVVVVFNVVYIVNITHISLVMVVTSWIVLNRIKAIIVYLVKGSVVVLWFDVVLCVVSVV